MPKRTVPAVALAVSATLLTVGAIGVFQSQSTEPAVTSIGARPLSTPQTQPATPTPTPTQGSVPAETASPPAVEDRPTRVRIPALDINADIVPVGLDKDQAVKVPENIHTIGWYKLGVLPGSESGSAVLVGHRDGTVDGHGTFYNLGELKLGQAVHVTTESGRKLTYKVVSRQLLPKSEFTSEAPELFATTGTPLLTLISCGGYYDRDAGGYQANVVVTAVPQAA